ncbi:hypothetical protein F5887DRAFT_1192306, partial [Amanita rubescens]
MMTLYYYYSIAIALHARRIQNKSAICDIKDEGGCKEASPFHSGCISTMSVQAIFDEVWRSNQGKVDVNHLFYLTRSHYLDTPRPAVDECQLQSVSVYKRRYGIQHESMLFTLWSKRDGKQFRLLVERTVDLPSILGLSRMSSSGDMLKFANDTALVIQTNATLSRKSYGEALWTLTMPTTPNTFVINLIQLVLLLRTIRDVDGGQQYSIINRSCFWLVRMARLAIVCLAQRAHAQDQVTITHTERAEKLGKQCGCVRSDGSRSHDADELSVGQLVDKYETDYQAFMRNYHASHLATVP